MNIRRILLLSFIIASLIVGVFAVTQIKMNNDPQDELVKQQQLRLHKQIVTQSNRPAVMWHESQAIAVMQMPTIHKDLTVVQGTSVHSLSFGPAHYSNTALPGQQGNSSYACHRIRSMCLNVDHLNFGDRIVMTYLGKRYTYVVFAKYETAANDWSAVSLNPHQIGSTPSRYLLTITTCARMPVGSQRRFVVHAKLIRE